MEDEIHIWFRPNTPAEEASASPTAPCGANMYPDSGDRPHYTDDPYQATCLACLRIELDRMYGRAGDLADLLGLYSEEDIEEAIGVD